MSILNFPIINDEGKICEIQIIIKSKDKHITMLLEKEHDIEELLTLLSEKSRDMDLMFGTYEKNGEIDMNYVDGMIKKYPKYCSWKKFSYTLVDMILNNYKKEELLPLNIRNIMEDARFVWDDDIIDRIYDSPLISLILLVPNTMINKILILLPKTNYIVARYKIYSALQYYFPKNEVYSLCASYSLNLINDDPLKYNKVKIMKNQQIIDINSELNISNEKSLLNTFSFLSFIFKMPELGNLQAYDINEFMNKVYENKYLENSENDEFEQIEKYSSSEEFSQETPKKMNKILKKDKKDHIAIEKNKKKKKLIKSKKENSSSSEYKKVSKKKVKVSSFKYGDISNKLSTLSSSEDSEDSENYKKSTKREKKLLMNAQKMISSFKE